MAFGGDGGDGTSAGGFGGGWGGRGYGGESGDDGGGGYGGGYGGGLGGWGGGLDGAPDVGTIGGNMSDGYGENSATLGGGLGGFQADANNQAMMAGMQGYDFGAAGFADPFGFNTQDFGNMFGWSNPVGLPTNVTDYAPSYSPTFTSFMDSPIGRFTRSLLGKTPLGMAVNFGYAASQNNIPGMASSAIGGLTGSGLAGSLAGIGTAAAMGQNVSGPLGSVAGGTLGSALGGQVAGPVGGMIGGQLGSNLGRGLATGAYGGSTDGSASTGNRNGGFDWAGLAGGLAGIYSANRASDAAKQAQIGMTSGVQQQLSDMFGPNSAYAQQLRQQLERKDAAAGRRSQYGPREVELQARLAQLQAQSAPDLIRANVGQQQAAFQAAQARQAQRNAQLNTLMQLGKSTGAFDWAGKQLNELFNPAPAYSFGTGPDFGNQDLGQYF